MNVFASAALYCVDLHKKLTLRLRSKMTWEKSLIYLPAPVYGHGFGKTPYDRHHPEQTLLYQLVEAHYPAQVDQLTQQGKSLPEHVHLAAAGYRGDAGTNRTGFLDPRYDEIPLEPAPATIDPDARNALQTFKYVRLDPNAPVWSAED